MKNKSKAYTNKSSKGGKVIESGGFGCIFKPSLKCKGKPRSEGTVTKLMKKKYAIEEYGDIENYKKMLESIPNYSDYFLIDGFSVCNPEELTATDLENFDKKCSALKKMEINSSNINSSLGNILALNMPYGGVDVGYYIDYGKINYNKLIKLNNSLIQLLKNGIIPMNNKNIYHCDIKDSNILVRENNDTLKSRLIDWGLSTRYNNGEKIPDVLSDRPFQFNVPFSIIIFNDDFRKMYAEFLENNPNPNFFSIRSFVINFVIYWINERGPGHLKTFNNIFEMFFEKNLIVVDENFKKELIEFEYTFYIIFEYISKILFKFTVDNKFDETTYFSEVFLKNLDIWGFTVTYLPIVEYLYDSIDDLQDIEIDIVKNIKNIILFVIDNVTTPINTDVLIEKLTSLNELFSKANGISSLQIGYREKSSKTTRKTSKNSNFKSVTKKSLKKSSKISNKTLTHQTI